MSPVINVLDLSLINAEVENGRITERFHTLRSAADAPPSTLVAGVGTVPEPPLTADILPDSAVVDGYVSM